MLERIENINKSKPYSGKRHSTNFDNYFNNNEPSVKVDKDSIVLSQAALFLAGLKWVIREIEYPSAENIVLDFFIEEFNFRTTINLVDFFNEPYQQFSVSETKMNNDSKKIVLAKIKVNKLKVKTLAANANSNTEIEVLREIFEKIKEMKSNHKLDTKDNSELHALLYGYEEKLYTEFSKIIDNIYTFVSKHDKFNIPDQFKFKDNDNELITIEEILTY